MFLFYVLRFFKKGDIIQGGTLFKGGHYLRKYGIINNLCVFLFSRSALADLSSKADIQRTFEAMRALDNKKIQGRKIRVKKNESKEQAQTTQEM